MDIDNIIDQYFRRGFTNLEILRVLEETHNVKLRLRTLERRLQKKRLWRRKNKTDFAEVASFIEEQLQGVASHPTFLVHRWMHQKCWMAGIVTDRETVRLLMRLLDPNGVDLCAQNCLRRRLYVSRGPNYVWHIDGYDKLKPYGICINGCIDGFSRKMIWLEAYKTNSDPHIIAGYFIDAVMEYNGFPQKIRMDHGIENTHVAAMQRFLHNTEDEYGFDSVFLGPSAGSQRIERWWCTLRSECAQFWMDHFDQLKADGYFVDSFLDKSLIQFCFLQTIQVEPDEVVHAWNDHRIRSTNNSRAPHGCPTLMHGVPNLYGVPNFLQSADLTKLEICIEECCFKDFPCDVDVFHLCTELMTEHRLVMTDDVYEITNLYVTLRQMISDELGE